MLRSPARKPARRFRPGLEWLEARDVPATTLFLDFGAGVGMGNTISITDHQLPPDLRCASAAAPT